MQKHRENHDLDKNNHKNLTMYMTNFDVLLTVHLSIILIINQLNAQILVL